MKNLFQTTTDQFGGLDGLFNVAADLSAQTIGQDTDVVSIDLAVMDYYAVQNLLSPEKTWFSLYSGRVSADLGAFGYVVGKKIPLAPLEK